jgi:hypothetical protein
MPSLAPTSFQVARGDRVAETARAEMDADPDESVFIFK